MRRLARTHPELNISYLDRTVCFCSTMNRIDLPHLVRTLEALVHGGVLNRITVEPTVAANARLALDRMLADGEAENIFHYVISQANKDKAAEQTLALEAQLQLGLIGSPNQLAAVSAGFTKEPAEFVDP